MCFVCVCDSSGGNEHHAWDALHPNSNFDRFYEQGQNLSETSWIRSASKYYFPSRASPLSEVRLEVELYFFDMIGEYRLVP